MHVLFIMVVYAGFINVSLILFKERGPLVVWPKLHYQPDKYWPSAPPHSIPMISLVFGARRKW